MARVNSIPLSTNPQPDNSDALPDYDTPRQLPPRPAHGNMNYEPNTEQWRKGDIVLEDMDAKEPKMLMRVVGYTRDGLCKSQYIDRRHPRRIYKIELKYLHGAHLFGLCEASTQKDWEAVRLWNHNYRVGTKVRVKNDFTGEWHETVTRTAAQLVKGVYAWVWLEGLTGAYYLRAVEPLEPPNGGA